MHKEEWVRPMQNTQESDARMVNLDLIKKNNMLTRYINMVKMSYLWWFIVACVYSKLLLGYHAVVLSRVYNVTYIVKVYIYEVKNSLMMSVLAKFCKKIIISQVFYTYSQTIKTKALYFLI